MLPIWHQDNASKTKPADLAALLELHSIPFTMEPSHIPNHTAFLTEKRDKYRAMQLIMQEDGRFAKELMEIEVTPEELAAIEAKKAANKALLAEKQAAYEKRKEDEARVIALIRNSEEDKEPEFVTLDEITEGEDIPLMDGDLSDETIANNKENCEKTIVS